MPDQVGHSLSLERQEFVNGLFQAFNDQLRRYMDFVGQLARLQAQLEMSERALIVVRDHLRNLLEETADEQVPKGWETRLAQVRFIGVRLGSACLELLQEHETLTTEDIARLLNEGQFRFRSGTPFREINAALIRQPQVRREGDRWIYVPQTRQEQEGDQSGNPEE